MGDAMGPDTRAEFSDLVEIMARLRGPAGCPWDREQDHRSLRRCLLEEAYEVLEAVDRGDARALCEELGDLLLQVVFHARLAEEAGEFDIADVIQGLHDKLVVRHPHVFGDKSLESAEEVLDEWESIKREEQGETAAEQAAGVPRSLPALHRAQKVQRRAARAGVTRSREEARAEAEAALGRLEEGSEEAVAELLWAAVALAREYGVEAEQALRERVDRAAGELGGEGRGRQAASGEKETGGWV